MNCPVCGNDTFDDDKYEYKICSECFWEYDVVQVEQPNLAGGANCHSLNEYKRIYYSLKQRDPSFSCRNESDRELILMLDHQAH